MRLIIFVLLLLTVAGAMYFGGTRILAITAEVSNYCKSDSECVVYVHQPHFPCGTYLQKTERARMDKIIEVLEKVNPHFARRRPRLCDEEAATRNPPICHFGKCIPEKDKWEMN